MHGGSIGLVPINCTEWSITQAPSFFPFNTEPQAYSFLSSALLVPKPWQRPLLPLLRGSCWFPSAPCCSTRRWGNSQRRRHLQRRCRLLIALVTAPRSVHRFARTVPTLRPGDATALGPSSPITGALRDAAVTAQATLMHGVPVS
jgi:hypothetical protein